MVELHTGTYAEAQRGRIWTGCAHGGRADGHELGLECHAGHGLTYANTPPVAAFPEVRELNIGHFLIGEAIFQGIEATIRQMKQAMAR